MSPNHITTEISYLIYVGRDDEREPTETDAQAARAGIFEVLKRRGWNRYCRLEVVSLDGRNYVQIRVQLANRLLWSFIKKAELPEKIGIEISNNSSGELDGGNGNDYASRLSQLEGEAASLKREIAGLSTTNQAGQRDGESSIDAVVEQEHDEMFIHRALLLNPEFSVIDLHSIENISTSKELSDLLGIENEDTVRSYTREGWIPADVMLKGLYLYNRRTVLQFLARAKHTGGGWLYLGEQADSLQLKPEWDQLIARYHPQISEETRQAILSTTAHTERDLSAYLDLPHQAINKRITEQDQIEYIKIGRYTILSTEAIVNFLLETEYDTDRGRYRYQGIEFRERRLALQ